MRSSVGRTRNQSERQACADVHVPLHCEALRIRGVGGKARSPRAGCSISSAGGGSITVARSTQRAGFRPDQRHSANDVLQRDRRHVAPRWPVPAWTCSTLAERSWQIVTVEVTLRRANLQDSQEHSMNWCRGWGSNPHDSFESRDFKSRASASFATPACSACYLTPHLNSG